MEIGARVAYVLGNDCRLGVLARLENDRATLELDNKKFSIVDPNRLHLVDYWKDRNSQTAFDRFREIPANTPLLDIFKSKKAIVFGEAAMRAMWYWGNHNVFSDKLKEPSLVVSNHKRLYGRWKSGRGSPPTIMCSSRNHSRVELFSTMLHEQIHQYNFQIEAPEGTFDRSEGTHGAAFKRWIPIIAEKTNGVKINLLADSEAVDADFDNPEEEPTTQQFIYAVVYTGKGWIGFQLANRRDLDSFAGATRQLLIHNQSPDIRIYAGISNLTRVRRELYSAKRGSFNINKVKSNVSTAILHLLQNTAKPIEGYMSYPDTIPERE
jgi:hypothetical protein